MARLSFIIDEVPISTVIAMLLAIEERDGPGETTVTTSDFAGELTNLVVNLPATQATEASEMMADVVGRLAASRSRVVDLEAALATAEDRATQLAEAVTRERDAAVKAEQALAASDDRRVELVDQLAQDHARTLDLEQALERERAESRFSTEGRQWAADEVAAARIADLEAELAVANARIADLWRAQGITPDEELEPLDEPEPPAEQVYACPEGCTWGGGAASRDAVAPPTPAVPLLRPSRLGEPMTWLTVAERDAHIAERHPHLVVSWSDGDTSEPAAERREIPKDELYRLRLEEEEPWREAEPPATEDEATSEPVEPEPEPKPDPNEQVDSDGRSAAGDYPCLLCAAEGRDTRFMTRNGLVGHRHSVKVDERLPFVCSCGKRSKTEGLWRNHRHAVASPMQHYLLGRPEDGDGEKGDDVPAEEAMAGG